MPAVPAGRFRTLKVLYNNFAYQAKMQRNNEFTTGIKKDYCLSEILKEDN